MLEIVRPIVIVVGLLLFEAIPEYVSSFWGDHEKVVKIVCGGLIIIAILLLDYAFRKGSSFRWIREKRYPTCSLEGVWFQSVSIPERPYSICRISYMSNGRWSYRGIAYDKDFKPAAEWRTHSLVYDKDQSKWYFGGNAWLLKFEGGAYRPRSRGYVTPIFQLPEEANLWRSTTTIPATIVDLDVDRDSLVFSATLTRANDLYRFQMPSIEKFKALPPAEVKDLLSKKITLAESTAQSVPAPRAR